MSSNPRRFGAFEIQRLSRRVFVLRSAGALASFSVAGTVLSACGDSDSPVGAATASGGKPPAQPTGTLRMALGSDVASIDPTLAFTIGDSALAETVYETLVDFNDDYSDVSPMLATRWESDAEARVWRFTLREGVTFHDGTPFDAAAVVAAVKYYQREGSGWGFLLGDVAVTAAGSHEVVFTYRAPFPDLLHNLTVAPRIMSPKLVAGSVDAASKRVAAKMVGTGAYQFAGQQAATVKMTPYTEYWGNGPYFQEVDFVVIKEESARIAALRSHDVDLIIQVPPQAAQGLGSDVEVLSTPTWSVFTLFLETRIAPFDDVRVRQAAMYAIDRQTIIDKIWLGQAKVADSFMPPGAYGYAKPSTTYAFDPDKAKQLMQEAGAAGKAKITLAIPPEATLGKEVSQAIAAQLNDVGFDCRVQNVGIPVMSEDWQRETPKYAITALEMGWVNGGPFHLTLGDPTNKTRWTTPEFQKLVGQMLATPNGPARLAQLARIQELLAEQLPALPLWVFNRIDCADNTLSGYGAPKDVYTRLDESFYATAGAAS